MSVIVGRRPMRAGTTIAISKDVIVVTPQVQTATSSHRILSDQSHSPYERLLAIGLGVALALVAALAPMVPTSTSVPVQNATGGIAADAVPNTAHGKATPRTTAAAPAAGSDSTSVE